jgi:hypothetical protein
MSYAVIIQCIAGTGSCSLSNPGYHLFMLWLLILLSGNRVNPNILWSRNQCLKRHDVRLWIIQT